VGHHAQQRGDGVGMTAANMCGWRVCRVARRLLPQEGRSELETWGSPSCGCNASPISGRSRYGYARDGMLDVYTP